MVGIKKQRRSAQVVAGGGGEGVAAVRDGARGKKGDPAHPAVK